MPQDYTTTALLASIKRRGMLPSTAQTLSDSDFLAIATEELQLYITELLLSVREEFLVVTSDRAVTVGTATYALPSRATAEALRNVLCDDGTGLFRPLPRVEEERASDFGSQAGSPAGYYLQDDSIILVPTPAKATTLRLAYFRRPSALVLPAATAKISSIDGPRTTVTTTAAVPTTFTVGTTLDIVDAQPGFRSPAVDVTISSTPDSTHLVLSSALPATVTVGMYVSLAGESPVPQVPVELHPLLAQRTTFSALEALGDRQAPQYEKICERMRVTALRILTPRVAGASKYLVNRHGPGFGGY